MEVNRISKENEGAFVLDGVISVIDVENWKGYDDTSVTAKMQAKFTDLIVFNKWELVDEMRFESALDRVGDMEVQTAWVKSVKGWVDKEVVMGVDGAMIRQEGVREAMEREREMGARGDHHHQDEVEVLSVLLKGEDDVDAGIVLDDFEELLLSAPKDEVYRIKGLITSGVPPPDSTGDRRPSTVDGQELYVLNWAFGRWSYTPLPSTEFKVMEGASARLTFILAKGQAKRWTRKLEQGGLLKLNGDTKSDLKIEKIGDKHNH